MCKWLESMQSRKDYYGMQPPILLPRNTNLPGSSLALRCRPTIGTSLERPSSFSFLQLKILWHQSLGLWSPAHLQLWVADWHSDLSRGGWSKSGWWSYGPPAVQLKHHNCGYWALLHAYVWCIKYQAKPFQRYDWHDALFLWKEVLRPWRKHRKQTLRAFLGCDG